MTSITGFSLHASVLNNKWLGNTPTFRNDYDSYVIVIKNGYAVCNNTFTNNRVFQDYISLKSTDSTNDVELANFDTRLILRFRGVIGCGYSFGLYSFYPNYDNSVDLGSSAEKFKNLYLSGTANVGALTSSGAISGTTGTFSGLVTIKPSGRALEIYNSSNVLVGAVNPNSRSFSWDGNLYSSISETYNCGESSSRWANVYSVNGNFSEDVTVKNILPSYSGSCVGFILNPWDYVCAKHGNFANDLYVAGSPIVGSGIALKNNIIDADSVYNKTELLFY